jgi:hypothetical protein
MGEQRDSVDTSTDPSHRSSLDPDSQRQYFDMIKPDEDK